MYATKKCIDGEMVNAAQAGELGVRSTPFLVRVQIGAPEDGSYPDDVRVTDSSQRMKMVLQPKFCASIAELGKDLRWDTGISGAQ